MDKIKQIADQADMIINGYAFTREENRIRSEEHTSELQSQQPSRMPSSA